MARRTDERDGVMRASCAGSFFGSWMLCAFDEAVGEPEFAAEFGFAGGHLAFVGLVVFAGEVEEAVEDEDLYFGVEGWL